MKIRGWIGAALCMVVLGAGAQDTPTPQKIGSWQIDMSQKNNSTTIHAGGSIRISLRCEKGLCNWVILSFMPCIEDQVKDLFIESQNKKIKFDTLCTPYKGGDLYFYRVKNSDSELLESMVKNSNSITIYIKDYSEKIKLSETQKAITEAKKRLIRYAMEEDGLYGYERKLSENEIKSGKINSELSMFRYNGEKNGTHQVILDIDNLILIIECKSPCEFYKTMQFQDLKDSAREVKRYKTINNSVIQQVFHDAINGNLARSAISDDNGVQHSIWFDEQKGMVLTPIAQ